MQRVHRGGRRRRNRRAARRGRGSGPLRALLRARRARAILEEGERNSRPRQASTTRSPASVTSSSSSGARAPSHRATPPPRASTHSSMYKLYVIPGSHACRAAMLMLEHKRVPYRRVDIVTLRTRSWRGCTASMPADRRARPAASARLDPLGDRLGTVPGARRRTVSGSRPTTRIARFLDEHTRSRRSSRRIPAQRAAVEEAERWANDTLQMAARRIPGAAVVRDPATFGRAAGDGRMGYLLYKRELVRRVIVPQIGRRGSLSPARRRSARSWPNSPCMLDRSTPGSPRGCSAASS